MRKIVLLCFFFARLAGWAEDSLSLRPEFEKLGLKPLTQGRSECTLFATLGVLEFDYAKAGQPIHLSDQFAKWVRSKGKIKNYRDLVVGIQNYGICRYELMPANGRITPSQPSKAAIEDAMGRRNVTVTYFRHAGRTFGFNDEEIQTMCDSIASGTPLSCGIRWPKNGDSGGKFTLDTKTFPNAVPGHSVVIVGYEKGGQWEGGGRMEFRNSFGESWGQGGYGWITFGFLKKNGEAAWAVHKAP